MVIKALKYNLLFFLVGLIFIWGVLVGALMLKNKYEGRLTIIFPSSQSDTRLKLLSIGEMTTNNKSIFSNMKIDPKETYKEIIMSNEMRVNIADDLDLTFFNIPTPKITNVPQTPLIKISMVSDHKKNLVSMLNSLLYNLNNKIEKKRNKYIEFRNISNQIKIDNSKFKIDLLTEKIKNIRVEYNLLHDNSNDYYSEKLFKLDDVLRNKKIELISLRTKLEQFDKILKLSAEEASLALYINSDYILKRLYQERAEVSSKLSLLAAVSGANNPDLKNIKEEYRQLTNNINNRLSFLNKGLNDNNTKRLILNIDIDERSEIFKVYVLNKIEYQTVVNEFNQIDIEIKTLKNTVIEMLDKQNQLEMLTKKLELHEAIYFSKLSNEQAYIDDAEYIYPDIQLWEGAKIVSEKGKYTHIIIIVIGIITSIIWVVILCLFYKKQHLKI
ncbi:hypothetical protein CZ809_00261 [Photobacterium piscicola]|uniref:Polysaccharide chain length determinant N-terminal domain-containing protein n=1 Tax=Photobacterium piscicola TaxID=1378299 RepID=A0A1T5HVB5_9GAMM|nr:hypothetical protein [Photobacterium piscicola]SKC30784.1 hypothetical protein CZ809_00261 [Photobacterium piscicola]